MAHTPLSPSLCVRVRANPNPQHRTLLAPSTRPTCHSFAHCHTVISGCESVFVSAAAAVVEGGAVAEHRVVIPPGDAVPAVARHWRLRAASWGKQQARLVVMKLDVTFVNQVQVLGKGKPCTNLIYFTINGRMTRRRRKLPFFSSTGICRSVSNLSFTDSREGRPFELVRGGKHLFA